MVVGSIKRLILLKTSKSKNAYSRSGGEVWRKWVVHQVNLPGAENLTSLQTGAIDATEWLDHYNDLAFGLYKAAKYTTTLVLHEPGSNNGSALQ